MAKKHIEADELNSVIANALNEFHRGIVVELKKHTEKAAKEMVKITRETAPVGKRKRHYKSKIAQRTYSESHNGITKLWYVRGPDYRLTHLLNNGHAMWHGGRYEGTNFVGKAVDEITPKYIKSIEEAIENSKKGIK